VAVSQFLDTPHHDGSALYVSNPSPQLGETVQIRLRVPAATLEQSVWVRAMNDGEPVRIQASLESEDGNERWYVANLTMHNPVVNYRWMLDEPGGYRWVTGRGTFERDVTDAGDFRLTTHQPPPEWTSEAVVYQIFPDRFARSQAAGDRPAPDWAVPTEWDAAPTERGRQTAIELFGGDLDGITEHLDYIKDLGPNTLYLTPFFAGNSAHRYDGVDFDNVDPLLGGNEALAQLSESAHEKGIRVIGDITTNHTGAAHNWMQKAHEDPNNPEHDFYYWYGTEDAPMPTDGSEPTADYVSWLGIRSLPKLNWTSKELIHRMIDGPESVIGKWLLPPYNLDGWRIDVANMTGRYRTHDLAHKVARHVVKTVRDINPEGMVVSEHFHDAADDLRGDGWISNMNYSAFTRPVWAWISDTEDIDFLGVPAIIPRRSGKLMVESMLEFDSRYSWATKIRLWNMLGSHDTPRIRTVTNSAAAVEVAAGMLFTYPGVPAFFMGDEGGFTASVGEGGRKTMPWGEIAGGPTEPSRQEQWDTAMHKAYRDLIAMRKSNMALRDGGMRWVFAADNSVGYLRETPDERVLVVIAREPWEGVTLPRYLVSSQPEPLYQSEIGVPVSLNVTDDGLTIGGQGPGVAIWRL
jgi:alpha-glucosidase